MLQPDLAICGGPSEGRRIAALAEAYQLELAPHCWGSALSFSAGVSLAFASPAATVIEYSLGGEPAAARPAERGRHVVDGRVSRADRARTRCHAAARVHRRVHESRRGRWMSTDGRHRHPTRQSDGRRPRRRRVVLHRGPRARAWRRRRSRAFRRSSSRSTTSSRSTSTSCPTSRPERAHFCLRVDDFNGVFRRAKAAGVDRDTDVGQGPSAAERCDADVRARPRRATSSSSRATPTNRRSGDLRRRGLHGRRRMIVLLEIVHPDALALLEAQPTRSG